MYFLSHMQLHWEDYTINQVICVLFDWIAKGKGAWICGPRSRLSPLVYEDYVFENLSSNFL